MCQLNKYIVLKLGKMTFLLNQPLLDGFYHCFRFGIYGKFAIDIVDVKADGADGDVTFVGNHL